MELPPSGPQRRPGSFQNILRRGGSASHNKADTDDDDIQYELRAPVRRPSLSHGISAARSIPRFSSPHHHQRHSHRQGGSDSDANDNGDGDDDDYEDEDEDDVGVGVGAGEGRAHRNQLADADDEDEGDEDEEDADMASDEDDMTSSAEKAMRRLHGHVGTTVMESTTTPSIRILSDSRTQTLQRGTSPFHLHPDAPLEQQAQHFQQQQQQQNQQEQQHFAAPEHSDGRQLTPPNQPNLLAPPSVFDDGLDGESETDPADALPVPSESVAADDGTVIPGSVQPAPSPPHTPQLQRQARRTQHLGSSTSSTRPLLLHTASSPSSSSLQASPMAHFRSNSDSINNDDDNGSNSSTPRVSTPSRVRTASGRRPARARTRGLSFRNSRFGRFLFRSSTIDSDSMPMTDPRLPHPHLHPHHLQTLSKSGPTHLSTASIQTIDLDPAASRLPPQQQEHLVVIDHEDGSQTRHRHAVPGAAAAAGHRGRRKTRTLSRLSSVFGGWRWGSRSAQPPGMPPGDSGGSNAGGGKGGDGDGGGGGGKTESELTKAEIDRFFAAHYRIIDAAHGRDKHGILFAKARGRIPELFFNVRNSRAYGYLFVFMVLLHIISAYFEDFRRTGYWVPPAIAVLFYIADSAMKMAYMTPRDYVTKRWNQIHVICTLLFCIDFGLMLAGHVQPFRLLRPWIYLSKDKELRRFFQALVAIRTTLALLFLYFFLYVFFFAAIGVHLFDEAYKTTCAQANIDVSGAFDNVLIAFVHMLTLSTTENYPNIMLPVFYERWSGFIFFGLFVLLALFYVLPMALALVNDSFWRAQGLQWKKDRKKERKTLIKAFNMLDVHSVGWLSLDQWCTFQGIVRPKLPRSAHQLTYKLACAGKPVLDWENFLEITNVLKAKLKARRSELRPISDKWKPLQQRVYALVRSDTWNAFICSLAVVHWITFCLKWEGRPGWVPEIVGSVQTFNVVCFIVEIALKVFAHGWRFERDAAVFKIPVHFLEYIFVLGSTVAVALFWAGQCGDGICAILGGGGQILRLTYRFKSNLSFLQIVDGILEISFKVISIIAFVVFSYAVLSYEIYRDVPAFEPYYCARNFDENHCVLEPSGDIVDPSGNSTTAIEGNFDSLACSSFVMFQLFTTSDWHTLMFTVAEYRTPWDSLFFISLFLLLQVVLMSLMVGTSIEAFFLIRENRTKANKNKNKQGSQGADGGGGGGGTNGEKRQGSKLKKRLLHSVQRLSLFSRKRKDATSSMVVKVTPADGTTGDEHTLAADQSSGHPHVQEPQGHFQDQVAQRRRKLEQRKMEKKKKRKEKRSGKLPSRCVAIVNEKMHKAGDLPLVKGDVIDILDQKDGRYKGKCRGRAGWFDAKCALVVLDEDMMHALEQNSDVKYEFQQQKSHVAQTTDDFLIMNSGVSRRDMVSDKITNMNADELIELNSLAKANLFARGFNKMKTPLRRNKVGPNSANPNDSSGGGGVGGGSLPPSHRRHDSTSSAAAGDGNEHNNNFKKKRRSSPAKIHFSQEPPKAGSISINSKAKELAASFRRRSIQHQQTLQPFVEVEEDEADAAAAANHAPAPATATTTTTANNNTNNNTNNNSSSTKSDDTPTIMSGSSISSTTSSGTKRSSGLHALRDITRERHTPSPRGRLSPPIRSTSTPTDSDSETVHEERKAALTRAAKLAVQAMEAMPQKSAMKTSAPSTITDPDELTNTSRSSRKKVLFAASVKQQDGSRKDLEIAQQKEKARQEGKPPDWIQSFLQKKKVKVVEGSLSPRPEEQQGERSDAGDRAAAADDDDEDDEVMRAVANRRASLAERPGTPHTRSPTSSLREKPGPSNSNNKPTAIATTAGGMRARSPPPMTDKPPPYDTLASPSSTITSTITSTTGGAAMQQRGQQTGLSTSATSLMSTLSSSSTGESDSARARRQKKLEEQKRKRKARNAKQRQQGQSPQPSLDGSNSSSTTADASTANQGGGEHRSGSGSGDGNSAHATPSSPAATTSPSPQIQLNTREQAMQQFRAAMAEKQRFVKQAEGAKSDTRDSDNDADGDQSSSSNHLAVPESHAGTRRSGSEDDDDDDGEGSTGGFDVMAQLNLINSQLG